MCKHKWAEVGIGQASVVVSKNGDSNSNHKDFVNISSVF